MWKKYLSIVGLSLIPAVLLYIGKNSVLFDWLLKNNILLSEQEQVLKYQFWSFLIGILGSGLVIPSRLAYIQRKYEIKSNSFIELIKFNKHNQFEALRKEIKHFNHPFNTRIFKKSKGFISWLKFLIFKEITLNLVYVNAISDDFNGKNLSFKIKPKVIEGMVGKSYKEEVLLIDFDLSNNNKYYLTNEQKLKVGSIEFCSTIPIFGKNKEVVAVVSIDSDQKVHLDESSINEFKKHFKYYAAFIDKHMLLN